MNNKEKLYLVKLAGPTPSLSQDQTNKRIQKFPNGRLAKQQRNAPKPPSVQWETNTDGSAITPQQLYSRNQQKPNTGPGTYRGLFSSDLPSNNKIQYARP